MQKPRRSLDGLTYYRPGGSDTPPPDNLLPPDAQPIIEDETTGAEGLRPRPAAPISAAGSSLAASDITAALNDLPSAPALTPSKASRRPGKRSGLRARRPLDRRKFVKWIVIALAVVILAVAGWLGYRFFVAAGSVFKGNALGILLSPAKPLKTDQYGNTNILLLGTSESDPNHPGAELTDSIMIASVNQKTHRAFLLSVPRDLWVTYEQSCPVGDSGKINAVYECSLGTNYGGLNSTTQNNEQAAELSAANMVTTVTGADIQYVAHLNLAVIQKVVDALGGIDITISSPDPRGILDRNFDWRCNYKCYLVKYPNGPAHLDGTQAMWLAQARNDSGGYGLPRSNFDREDNQRKILAATKDKATSIGFLANPVNVVNLLDALGSNIHTTIDSSEVKSFITVAKDTPTQNIASIDILNDAPGVLTTGTGPDGSSIVEPAAGLYDYSDLQAFVGKLLQGQAPIISEAATVDVLNGSGVTGVASQVSDSLSSAGITIGQVASTVANSSYPHYTIYDLTGGKKPNTLNLLKSKLSGATVATKLPAGVYSTANFVVIVGQDPSASSNSSGSSTGQ